MTDPIGFKLLTILSLTTGAVFIMWLGEQINNRGIGNGISLVIFAGIVARLPNALFTLYEQAIGDTTGTVGLSMYQVLLLAVIVTATIAFICFFTAPDVSDRIVNSLKPIGSVIVTVLGPSFVFAAQAQYGRRYSANFCQFDLDVPGDDSWHVPRPNMVAGRASGAYPRRLASYLVLCRSHRLLLLLLYGCRLQSRRRRL